jgi:hypothetical protein
MNIKLTEAQRLTVFDEVVDADNGLMADRIRVCGELTNQERERLVRDAALIGR